MGNRSFPRWAGPVVGAWAGLYFPLRRVAYGGPVEWKQIGLGVGCGLLAGLVIWLADAPPADPPPGVHDRGRTACSRRVGGGSGPGVNILVNAASARVNWGVRDWPGRWSRVVLGSSLLLTALFLGLLAW